MFQNLKKVMWVNKKIDFDFIIAACTGARRRGHQSVVWPHPVP